MIAADAHYFTDEAVGEWTRIGEKHRLRDEQFLRRLESWFRPGPVLELGAATGHLSAILQARGHDVTASDVSSQFVNAIAARGLPARLVDATRDIRAQTGRTFANIFAQGVTPLIRRDRATVLATLAAIHGALEAHGLFISISPRAWRSAHPENYFTPREQLGIARESGLFGIVAAFPHQVVPTSLYRPWNARVLNFLDFHAAHLAAIRLVWVAEKLG
jgi:SAM-dependent methyltransferase